MNRRAFVAGTAALAATPLSRAVARPGGGFAPLGEVQSNRDRHCAAYPAACAAPHTWLAWLPDWAKTALGAAGAGGVLWALWRIS